MSDKSLSCRLLYAYRIKLISYSAAYDVVKWFEFSLAKLISLEVNFSLVFIYKTTVFPRLILHSGLASQCGTIQIQKH